MRRRPRTMYLLNQTNQAVRSRLEQALRDLQMTGIQYTVLSIVGDHDGLSSADLSRRFFVTPQTMNEIIVGLERRGFISRQEDPANRRILRLRLTSPGRELLGRCDEIADRIEADAFDWAPAEQLEEFRRLLRMLLTGLRERDALLRNPERSVDAGEDDMPGPPAAPGKPG